MTERNPYHLPKGTPEGGQFTTEQIDRIVNAARESAGLPDKTGVLSFEEWSLKNFKQIYKRDGIFAAQYDKYYASYTAEKTEIETETETENIIKNYSDISKENVNLIVNNYEKLKTYNLGIRTLPPDQTYNIGDRVRNSYDWDFENDISSNIKLPGVSVTGISDDYSNPQELLDNIQAALNVHKYGSGQMVIIGGHDFILGTDPGEHIIPNGKVLLFLRK